MRSCAIANLLQDTHGKGAHATQAQILLSLDRSRLSTNRRSARRAFFVGPAWLAEDSLRPVAPLKH